MKHAERGGAPRTYGLARLFAVWAGLGTACGVGFTLAFRSMGGEAYAMLAFGTVLGVVGGLVFVALYLLQRRSPVSRLRLAVSGVLSAALLVVLTSLRTSDLITLDATTGMIVATCLALGGIFGWIAAVVAAEPAKR